MNWPTALLNSGFCASVMFIATVALMTSAVIHGGSCGSGVGAVGGVAASSATAINANATSMVARALDTTRRFDNMALLPGMSNRKRTREQRRSAAETQFRARCRAPDKRDNVVGSTSSMSVPDVRKG